MNPGVDYTPTKTRDPNKLTYPQQKFLLNALKEYSWYTVVFPKRKKPDAVVRAQAIIKTQQRKVNAYNVTENRRQTKARRQHDKLIKEAREKVYFGTPQEAQNAVAMVTRWRQQIQKSR